MHTSPTKTRDRQPRTARPEVRRLLGLTLIPALILAFGLIAEEVITGGSAAFDRRILLLFRSLADPNRILGPAWVPEALRDLTSLGSVAVLSIIVLAVLGYALMIRDRFAFVSILVVVPGGQAISTMLKTIFDRPRPDFISGAPHVFTTSFPSGHAMLSAVTYLTLAAMLARLDPRRGVKVYFLAIAVTLTVLIGVSRVALGVHWPTDVLAGWCAGSAWTLLCTTAIARLSSRGRPGAIENVEAP